jgi:hypothetical protein
VWIEELIELVETSASSELYSVLKRPDEKFVTEAAYDNPVFVEDLVRNVAVKAKAHRASLGSASRLKTTSPSTITTPGPSSKSTSRTDLSINSIWNTLFNCKQAVWCHFQSVRTLQANPTAPSFSCPKPPSKTSNSPPTASVARSRRAIRRHQHPNIPEDSNILLKHHGSYQQDDRDLRAELNPRPRKRPGAS